MKLEKLIPPWSSSLMGKASQTLGFWIPWIRRTIQASKIWDTNMGHFSSLPPIRPPIHENFVHLQGCPFAAANYQAPIHTLTTLIEVAYNAQNLKYELTTLKKRFPRSL